MARLRREVHTELFRDIANYVIDMAVVAPGGPLRGTVVKDGDRLVVTLPEGDERTVEVDWPDFDSTPLKEKIESIKTAADTEVVPPLLVFRLLATALGVEDIDMLVDELTDDDGNWVGWPDPDLTAGQVAVEAFRRGEDPAEVLA